MIGSTALQAFRTPSFALLWSAQVVSSFGDKITFFALAYVTWQLTHSALSTVAAAATATIPYAVFGFFGGAIADALGYRRVMIGCDLVRMLVIGAIPLVLALGFPLAIVYSLVLVASLCSAVFNPARMAIVPEIVPYERLGASNSMVYASDRTIEIIGTVAAGITVAAFGTQAFYVDAGTFAISAVLLLRMTADKRPPRDISWRALVAEAGEGLLVLRDHAVLRANTIFSLLGQLSLPVVNGLTPVLIFREYALGPEQLGVVEAATAVGAVAAGILFPSILGRRRKGPVIAAGFGMLGSVLMAIAASPGFPTTVVLFVLVGVANVAFFVPNVTLSQEVTPPPLRARVFGSRMALLNLTWLPVMLLTGSLADLLPVQAVFFAAGAFTILVAVVGSLFRSIRDVP